MPAVTIAPVLDPTMRALCARPYEGHPRGCPNLNRKEGCPGKVPLCADVFDLSRWIAFIYSEFDLGAHVERMRAAHPDWSWRQLTCCLYWQGTARKALEVEISAFLGFIPKGFIVNRCPEALGVNVTETMRRAGVELQWPPTTKTIHVAMAGWSKVS